MLCQSALHAVAVAFWSWLTNVSIENTFEKQLRNTTATACNADPQSFHCLQNEVATYFAFYWVTNHNLLRLLGDHNFSWGLQLLARDDCRILFIWIGVYEYSLWRKRCLMLNAMQHTKMEHVCKIACDTSNAWYSMQRNAYNTQSLLI